MATTPKKKDSVESTLSEMSTLDPYEKPRIKSQATFLFSATSNKQGGYTSLFTRKLLPPLGFYREADKYGFLKKKHADDPEKLEAIDEMWGDYERYQIRKRFRWPPTLFFSKYFWTTGYYADYQKIHRAKRIHKPGDDSSEEELKSNVIGAYLIAEGDGDINVEEFARYRDAKQRKKLRMTWAAKERLDEGPQAYGYGKGTSDKQGMDQNNDDWGGLFPQKGKKDTEDAESDDGGLWSMFTGKTTKSIRKSKKGKKKKSKYYDDDDDDALSDSGSEGGKRMSRKSRKSKVKKKKSKYYDDDDDDALSDSGSESSTKGKKKKGRKSAVHEVETIVEYTIIRNPEKHGPLEGLTQKEIEDATAGKTIKKGKKSRKTVQDY